MAAILFNSTEPFQQIVNIRSTEKKTLWNLVKIGQVVLEKKTSKYYRILCMYIAQVARADKLWWNKFL